MRRCFVLAALVVAGCSFHHRPPAPEPARGPARDSLVELDETRGDSLAARGPVEGALALLAPDVVYLRAGLPTLYGRDAVRDAVAGFPAATPPGTNWQPVSGGVSYDLRSAYTFGIVARILARREGVAPAVRLERYIAYWERAPGQPWRIAAYAEVNAPSSPPIPSVADRTTPPRRSRSQPIDEAAAKVRAADSLFADLSDRMGVPYAFSNTVTEDGVVFAPSRIVAGPDAVREYLESRPRGTSFTWRPVYAAVTGSLDLGFTVGESISTGRGPSGAAVQRFGKYLTVWRRQKDGWRVVVDGGSLNR